MGAAPKLAILSELLDSFLLSTSTETIKNRNSHQLQYMCFRLDTQNKVSLERELYLQKESHLSLWNLRISGRMVRGETKVPKAEQFLESFRADPPGYRRGTKNPPPPWSAGDSAQAQPVASMWQGQAEPHQGAPLNLSYRCCALLSNRYIFLQMCSFSRSWIYKSEFQAYIKTLLCILASPSPFFRNNNQFQFKQLCKV